MILVSTIHRCPYFTSWTSSNSNWVDFLRIVWKAEKDFPFSEPLCVRWDNDLSDNLYFSKRIYIVLIMTDILNAWLEKTASLPVFPYDFGFNEFQVKRYMSIVQEKKL